MTRLLTLSEAAEALRVSVRTVQRLIESGQLRSINIGRRTLVAEKEIDNYLAAAYRKVT